MQRTIALTAISVALLVEPVGAQDTGSALSTILQMATSKSYGAHLITAEGRPLHFFSADTARSTGIGANSRCSDACTQQRPPLIASAGGALVLEAAWRKREIRSPRCADRGRAAAGGRR
jgi:predicted lipoprotein with Yx(FWY)xxD motif